MAAYIARRVLTPALLAAPILAGIAATPLPAAARDNDARSSSLPRETIIQDRNGFTAGRDQSYRDGRVVQRDEHGYRSGGVRPDGTITDKNGYRVGRVERR